MTFALRRISSSITDKTLIDTVIFVSLVLHLTKDLLVPEQKTIKLIGFPVCVGPGQTRRWGAGAGAAAALGLSLPKNFRPKTSKTESARLSQGSVRVN